MDQELGKGVSHEKPSQTLQTAAALQQGWQAASWDLKSLREMKRTPESHDVSFKVVNKCFENLRGKYTQLH